MEISLFIKFYFILLSKEGRDSNELFVFLYFHKSQQGSRKLGSQKQE